MDVNSISESNELSIKDFNFIIVNAAISFCYDQPLPHLTNNELIQLMAFAHQYGINKLKVSQFPGICINKDVTLSIDNFTGKSRIYA